MLSPEQEKVVYATGGIIVTAPPGTGKTYAVAYRIQEILSHKNLKPFQGVLALTFTNVAVNEISRTYENISGKSIRHPNYVMTIDSFLNQFLFFPFGHSFYGMHKKLKIISPNSNYIDKRFIKIRKASLTLNDINYDINGKLPNKYVAKGITETYLTNMKKHVANSGLVTQGDVNYICLQLLNNSHLLDCITCMFPHIIIDEAQDCSDIQMAIIDKLSTRIRESLVLLGDPFQAIYEFRNSKPDLFLQKTRDTKHWQQLNLIQSYRSGDEICNFLNIFHPKTEIQPNKEIEKCCVKVLIKPDCESIIKEFLTDLDNNGITTNKDTVAIIYGAHSSKINPHAPLVRPETIWNTTNDNLSCLPFKAKLAYLSKDYQASYDLVEQYIYYTIYKERLSHKENLENTVFMDDKVKSIIWDICKNLPDIEKTLGEWEKEINDLLNKKLTSKAFMANYKLEEIKLNLKYKKLSQKKTASLIEANNSQYNFTITNVHQIKGRTFDAVMVFLEAEAKKKFSIRKLDELLVDKEFFTCTYAEDKRCLYVALSRPRKYLYISWLGEDNDNKYQAICNKIQIPNKEPIKVPISAATQQLL